MSQPRPQPRDRGFNAAGSVTLRKFSETHNRKDYGKYEEGERERVFAAAKILKEAPLYIEELPEFNLQDVENAIKRGIAEHSIQYVFNRKVMGQ